MQETICGLIQRPTSTSKSNQEDNNGGERHSKPRLQYTRNLISDQTTYLGNPTLGLKFFFDR